MQDILLIVEIVTIIRIKLDILQVEIYKACEIIYKRKSFDKATSWEAQVRPSHTRQFTEEQFKGQRGSLRNTFHL